MRRWCARKRQEKRPVGGESAPALADDGGVREGGRQRGKAEEDLGEQVVVFERWRRRRRAGAVAEAAHLVALVAAHPRCLGICFLLFESWTGTAAEVKRV